MLLIILYSIPVHSINKFAILCTKLYNTFVYHSNVEWPEGDQSREYHKSNFYLRLLSLTHSPFDSQITLLLSDHSFMLAHQIYYNSLIVRVIFTNQRKYSTNLSRTYIMCVLTPQNMWRYSKFSAQSHSVIVEVS